MIHHTDEEMRPAFTLSQAEQRSLDKVITLLDRLQLQPGEPGLTPLEQKIENLTSAENPITIRYVSWQEGSQLRPFRGEFVVERNGRLIRNRTLEGALDHLTAELQW